MEARAMAHEPEPPRWRRPVEQRTPSRRLLVDRLARWTVTAGGMSVIAGILGILLFILIEVLPLVGGADVEPGRVITPAAAGGAVLTDEYRTLAAVLYADGVIRVYELDSGDTVDEITVVEGGGLAEVRAVPRELLFTASTADGAAVAVPLDFQVDFVGSERVITARPGALIRFEFDGQQRPVRTFSVRIDEDDAAVGAAVLADGSVTLLRREVTENMFTGEVSESWSRVELQTPTPPQSLLLDRQARNLYGTRDDGTMLWWSTGPGGSNVPQEVGAPGSPVTALGLLLGDRSLVVGRADGSLEVWFAVRDEDGESKLTRIRGFTALDGAVRHIASSARDKGFVALAADDSMGLFYSTSGRTIWTGRSPVANATDLAFAPKADGLFLLAAKRLAELEVDNPHPQIGLGALFGKVWYEGYPEPDYVWQSTGGTDDFESKLSLTPLIVGTLKGTVYSLFLAIPLGVLGAMYTSQFMTPGLKRYVKPTVEIMAALPSVVLGFLAGLWLAPRVERILPGLLLSIVVVPALVVLGGAAWKKLSGSRLGSLAAAAEVPFYMAVVAIGLSISLAASEPLEAFAFAGSFQDWLLSATGLAYDQRNAVVVGLAMGFAVIPIIFSIAEDAFSNVPRTLSSASLALGATRWQTVVRVVLPTASPGIFSAIMIGFGRAIGETMIVLMATGNTPIMDWSPFNGFRTLSANIAVEIPEAPLGATLYRTLFLAALLLFIFTFVINTVAEVIRQRLRERYQH
jgi:phosphate transport system permease protein